MNRRLVYAICATFVFGTPIGWAQVPEWAEREVFSMQDVEIVLYRPGTILFSGAPRYRITIQGDGSVIIDLGFGTYNEENILSDKLPVNDVREILNGLLAQQFFDLPDEYRGGARLFRLPKLEGDRFKISRLSAVDQSFVEIGLTIGDHSKKITMFGDFGPRALYDMADKIDKLVGVDKLVVRQKRLEEVTSFGLQITFVEMRDTDTGETRSLYPHLGRDAGKAQLEDALIGALETVGRRYDASAQAAILFSIFGRQVLNENGSAQISYFIEISIQDYDDRLFHQDLDDELLTFEHHRNTIIGAGPPDEIRAAVTRDCVALLAAALRPERR